MAEKTEVERDSVDVVFAVYRMADGGDGLEIGTLPDDPHTLGHLIASLLLEIAGEKNIPPQQIWGGIECGLVQAALKAVVVKKLN